MKGVFLYVSLLLMVDLAWSQPTPSTAKPWAYWWWLGSAVNQPDIKKNLEEYAKAGFGGMHIIPIYGVKGKEAQFIDYLSPAWLNILDYTVQEAKRLGLGIDMTLGTGWPLGGRIVGQEHAAQAFRIVRMEVAAGEKLSVAVDTLVKKAGERLQIVTVFDEGGFVRELRPIAGRIEWYWKNPSSLLFLLQTPTGQKVKRAAPGGEGWVLDHFGVEAVEAYVDSFERVLTKAEWGVRAIYNDSYEVYGANWSHRFLERFRELRGYNLMFHLDVLAKPTADSEREKRVRADYMETISDILREDFTETLADFAHSHSKVFRNEAHGSPANILDLYAASDIPESEFFGTRPYDIPNHRIDPDYDINRFGVPHPLILKLASSAAHVSGKRLVSSETATWIGNHFKVALSQIKPIVDESFVSGINHIFYHGVPYSPPSEPFPGWLFYASTNFNRNSHFWGQLPLLNGYVERCQTILQGIEVDNDILLYLPIHDFWHKVGPKSQTFTMDVHTFVKEMLPTPFGETALALQEAGYSFDYVSDLQLQQSQVVNNSLLTPGKKNYKAIVVPACEYLPLETLVELDDFRQKGVPVIFVDKLPQTVNGWKDWESREKVFLTLRENFSQTPHSSLEEVLAGSGVFKESIRLKGIHYIRGKSGRRTLYYLTNLENKFSQGLVRLESSASSVRWYDPLRQAEGFLPIKNLTDGAIEIPLALAPGESVFLELRDTEPLSEPVSPVYPAKEYISLNGAWQVSFISGEPVIPKPFTTDHLFSWTKSQDTMAAYFAGIARYTLSFSLDKKYYNQAIWLDLGDVRETADVKLNGIKLGTAWCLPFRLRVPPKALKEKNVLEIEVNNLSANRIRYIDKQGQDWKKFYDINIVDINYKAFDASAWAPVVSGLLGPVKLIVDK